jgi:hypothetical protein
MTTNRVTDRTRLRTRSLAVTAFLFAALSLSPVAALADGHGHGKHGGNGHGAPGKHQGYATYPVAVPRVIVHGHHGWYDPYYAGSAYYGPHRHVHYTYRFPVWVGSTVVYHPYTYCGDSVYVPAPVYAAPPVYVAPPVYPAPLTVSVPLPRLAIGWSVAGSGFAVGGTYIGH